MEYLTKSDVVTAALRELVITGELAAGAELRQRDLAARFGVSPTPVREALKRLESEGLVEYDVHRGARVIDTAFEADEENFLIRASLEGLAIRLAAARISDEDLAELEQLNRELATHDSRDIRAVELNRQFHFKLFEAARSPLLLALLRLLWHSFKQAARIARPMADSVEQHREIIDALRAGDADRAEATLQRHILEGRSAGEDALAGRLNGGGADRPA